MDDGKTLTERQAEILERLARQEMRPHEAAKAMDELGLPLPPEPPPSSAGNRDLTPIYIVLWLAIAGLIVVTVLPVVLWFISTIAMFL